MKSIEIREHPERLWLLVSLVLTLAFSFSPFEIAPSVSALREKGVEALTFRWSDLGFDSIGHFCLFFFLGALIATAHGRWLERRRFAWLAVAAIAACAIFELIQFFILERHARLSDLVFHLSGLLLGMWVSIRSEGGRRCCVAIQERGWSRSLLTATGLLVLGLTMWWVPALIPAIAGDRIDWQESFPLMIGNELDGSRPWQGEIEFFGVYGRALSENEVKEIREIRETGSAVARTAGFGLLAGYDFRDKGADVVVPEGELNSEEMTMEVPQEIRRRPSGGILLGESAMLVTRGPVADLTRAMRSSGAFSVEASVRPSNLTQGGPARIVSVSSGVNYRNFTLAQSKDSVVFRVQNGVSGNNGSLHALEAKGLEEGVLQHWVAVYDHGVSRIYKNGHRLPPTMDLRDPVYHCLLGSGRGAAAAGMVFVVACVALPLAVILSTALSGWTLHGTALTLAILAGLAPGLAFLFYAAVSNPFSPERTIWQVAVALAAYPLMLRYAASETSRP